MVILPVLGRPRGRVPGAPRLCTHPSVMGGLAQTAYSLQEGNMKRYRPGFVGVALLFLCVSGCATEAKLTYREAKPQVIDGYNFVIPRTVLNVLVTNGQAAPTADGAGAGDSGAGKVEAGKGGAAGAGAGDAGKPAQAQKDAAKSGWQMTLVSVPVAYDTSKNLLKVFSVRDDSAGSSFWTPTTLTSVTYADRYIVSSIGTQVTDNRAAVIGAVIGAGGLAAKLAGVAGFAAKKVEACPEKPSSPPPPFAIDKLNAPEEGFVPGSNKCWGYKVDVAHAEDGPDKFAVSDLPVNTPVSWFPYPACRSVKVSVYACSPNDTTTCTVNENGPQLTGSANVSLGAFYRPAILPVKGKIALHADLCVADITNDTSGISSGWDLLEKAIADYKSLSASKSTTTSK